MLNYNTALKEGLEGAHLILDTGAFVDASDSEAFRDLIKDFANSGSMLWTIPSVQFEFARYANTVDEYNELISFVKGLGVTVFNRVEEVVLDKTSVFAVALNRAQHKSQRRMSYTDAILCTLLFYHRTSNTYLITPNHNDIPLALFDRMDVITFDVGDNIRTEGIYQLSKTKLQRILGSL